jgi:hypothetical protein
VRHSKRRLTRLEDELAEARAAQAALSERVAMFEKIAAAAGAALDEQAQVPATLLAAAAHGRQEGAPVRLAVGGSDVIAVIGDEGGDPGEWWAAIHELAARRREAS